MPASPLVFLDVDGVLNPYPETPAGYVEYDFFSEDDEPVRLCVDHGSWLEELRGVAEIVWATGWNDDANTHICTTFGFGPFVVARMPATPFEPRDKVAVVDAIAGSRPAAWIDDIVTDEARAWASTRPHPTLLVEVDPAVGLTREHVDVVAAWLDGLARL